MLTRRRLLRRGVTSLAVPPALFALSRVPGPADALQLDGPSGTPRLDLFPSQGLFSAASQTSATDVVHISGDETILGTKTFAASPIFGVQGSTLPYLQVASLETTAGWSLNSRQLIFNGVADNTLTMAFNHTPSQSKEDSSLAQWGLQLESSYLSESGGAIQSEFIVSYTSSDGSATRRPLTAVTRHNDHTSTVGIAGRLDITTSNLEPKFVVEDGIDGGFYFYAAAPVILAAYKQGSPPGDEILVLPAQNYPAIFFRRAGDFRGSLYCDLANSRLFMQTNSGLRIVRFSGTTVLDISATPTLPTLVVRTATNQAADASQWQDASGALLFSLSSAGLLTWANTATVQTTVGPSGGAAPLPTAPQKYLKVVADDGVTYVVPAFPAK